MKSKYINQKIYHYFRLYRYLIIRLLTLIILLGLLIIFFGNYLFGGYTNNAFVRLHVYKVSPRESGFVQTINAHNNAYVYKGELLIQLNSSIQKEIVAKQKATTKLLLSIYNKDKELFKKDDISEVGYKQSKTNYEVQNSILKIDRINLTHMSIVAPTSGYLTNFFVRKGEHLTEGQPIFVIVNYDDILIQANFKDYEIANIDIGKQVTVEVPSVGKTEYKGKVVAISHAVGDDIKTNSGLQYIPKNNNWFPLPEKIPVYIQLETLPKKSQTKLINGASAEVTIS